MSLRKTLVFFSACDCFAAVACFMNRYSLKQTVAPAIEPVTLDEAKAHLRVDTDDENAYITSLIAASRHMVEAYTQRQLITATFTAKFDDFPTGTASLPVPRTPLGSVSSVTYVDYNGVTQTLSSAIYEVISDDTEAYVVLKPSQVWPTVQSLKRQAVTVTFTAGYGNATTDVPEAARSAILMLVGNLFENREAVATGTIAVKVPFALEALLDSVSVQTV